jgi:DHA2 family multidrug resistance protein
MGGVMTLVMMPIAGAITGRLFAPKFQIAGALIVSGFALLHMSRLNLDMSFDDVAFARAFQVCALPFMFIGISANSYVGLPPAKSNEASSLLNLTRNLGGGLGVSLATSLLAWRTQFHHARLAEHVTPYDDWHGRTLGSFAQAVQAQASVLSYLDVYHTLGLVALCVWPFVLLLKTAPRGSAARGH